MYCDSRGPIYTPPKCVSTPSEPAGTVVSPVAARKPVTDPKEFESLDAEQLVRRLWPPLRKAGLVRSKMPPDAKKVSPDPECRHRENVVQAAYELLREWHGDPPVGEDFGEFMAKRLANQTRKVDQKANPHLYDKHGKYLPERSELSLDAPVGDEVDTELVDLVEGNAWDDEWAGPKRDPEWEAMENEPLARKNVERLVSLLHDHDIHPASALHVVRTGAKVKRGEITNGRQMAQALGASDYKSHPATQALLAMHDLVKSEDWPTEAEAESWPMWEPTHFHFVKGLP